MRNSNRTARIIAAVLTSAVCLVAIFAVYRYQKQYDEARRRVVQEAVAVRAAAVQAAQQAQAARAAALAAQAAQSAQAAQAAGAAAQQAAEAARAEAQKTEP